MADLDDRDNGQQSGRSGDDAHTGQPADGSGAQRLGPEAPEPPHGWTPQEPFADPRESEPEPAPARLTGVVGSTMITLNGQEARDFESARMFVTASQIIAVVSLFFGGVVLSAVALVVAFLGFRKLSAIAEAHSDKPAEANALKRSGIVALGMSVLALVINIVSLVVLYPMLMQELQQNGFAGLFPGNQPGPTGAGGQGSSLFG